jgi:putative exosortase-associated protein (TIGR04073 family)
MTQLSRMLLIFALLFFTPYLAMANGYPTKIGEKLGIGIANVVTGPMEIPKTMMITTGKRGPGYGMTVGFMTGMVQMLGRTLSGALDLATFMIPTRPIVRPELIWNNFNTETSYNSNWQMR